MKERKNERLLEKNKHELALFINQLINQLPAAAAAAESAAAVATSGVEDAVGIELLAEDVAAIGAGEESPCC